MESILSSLYNIRQKSSSGLHFRILDLLTRPFVRLSLRGGADPVIKVNLGRQCLWMNWSHNLPHFLRNYPNYETEIGRLAAFIQQKMGRLIMIDVGANVGDTIATLPVLQNARFLCIEGSQNYYSLLTRNLEKNPNTKCVNAFCSDGESLDPHLSLVEVCGTAHLERNTDSPSIDVPTETLDVIAAREQGFMETNFLKIDTDGFDFRVLKGAVNLLEAARPALHFEFSPRLWQEVGNTDIPAALKWLGNAGYKTAIIYDNLGYLIGADSLAAPVLLPGLREYASKRKDFYMNIIAFHEESGMEKEFLVEESRGKIQ